MKHLIRMHTISFKHAYDGLRWALTTQPNFRIHFVLSALSLFLASVLRISAVELTVVVFAIVLGLTAEMINTAIEAMTDLISQEWRKEAKIAKDVSAGMMLTVSVGASVVACVIFVPKIAAYLL